MQEVEGGEGENCEVLPEAASNWTCRRADVQSKSFNSHEYVIELGIGKWWYMILSPYQKNHGPLLESYHWWAYHSHKCSHDQEVWQPIIVPWYIYIKVMLMMQNTVVLMQNAALWGIWIWWQFPTPTINLPFFEMNILGFFHKIKHEKCHILRRWNGLGWNGWCLLLAAVG